VKKLWATSIIVGFSFGQNSGAPVYNAIISVAPQTSSLSPSGFPMQVRREFTCGTCTLNSGSVQQFYLAIPANEFSSGNQIGSEFNGYIWLNYSTTPTGPSTNAAKVATLVVKITYNPP
jgi:hypothetical protein